MKEVTLTQKMNKQITHLSKGDYYAYLEEYIEKQPVDIPDFNPGDYVILPEEEKELDEYIERMRSLIKKANAN